MAVDLNTWVSIGSLVVVSVSLFGAIAWSVGLTRSDLARVEARIDHVDGRIERLDDRVYALALGLKPVIDGASPSVRG